MSFTMQRDDTNGLGRSGLLSCPRRIQDRIFRLAYAGGAAHVTGVLPLDNCGKIPHRMHAEHKINEFLVSKRYFATAARAWARNQIFDLSDHNDPSLATILHDGGIVLPFARALKIKSSQLHWMKKFPRVQTLIVEVAPGDLFDKHSQLLPWATRLQDRNLEQTPILASFLKVRSSRLRRIMLHALDCPDAMATQDEIWRGNVRALEGLMLRKLERNRNWRKRMIEMCPSPNTRRKSDYFSQRTHAKPLYPGSQVYLDDITTEIVATPWSDTSSLVGLYPASEIRSRVNSISTIDGDSSLLLDEVELYKSQASRPSSAPTSVDESRHDSVQSDNVAEQPKPVTDDDHVVPDTTLQSPLTAIPISEAQGDSPACPVPPSPDLHGVTSFLQEPEIPFLNLDTDELDAIGALQPQSSSQNIPSGADTTDREHCVPTGSVRSDKAGEAQDETTDDAYATSVSKAFQDDENPHSMLVELLGGGSMLFLLSFVWLLTHGT